MGRHLARRAFPARIAGLLALALVGITCRDRDPMGPGLPSQGSLAIAPRMERAASEGGPSFVSLSHVRGVLTPVGGGSSYTVDAPFVGDTATLAFDVTFPGPTQRYTLELAAIDTAGDTLFRSMREVTASPGNNAPVQDTLRYVAPDTAVASIVLAAADSLIVGTDTLLVTATGIDRAKQPVSKLYIGWSSSDTAVVRVVSTGPSSARIIGRDVDAAAWIVGRAFNGVADSLAVRVSVAVGSVAIAADTIRTVAGSSALATAKALSRAGTTIDRPIVWSSLDTTIAAIRPALPADGQSPVPGQTLIAGLRAGTTRVVARSDSKSDTSVVVVAPAPVAVVHVVPDSIALLVGDSARFGVVLLAANGDTLTGRTVSWTTGDAKLATIDAVSGTVRAVAPGTVAVVATAEGVVDTAWVRVAVQPAAIVRTAVSPKSVRFLALGESAQLVAQSYAADSSLTPGRYGWAIHGGAGLISVDSLGRVVALATGSAWVVVTEAGGTADSAQVTVEQLLQTVLISPATVRGFVGESEAQIDSAAGAVPGTGVAVTDGRPSLSTVTIPGGSSAPTIWLKATGAPGDVADVVFSRPGSGSYRARIAVTTQPLAVARMTLTR